MREKELLDLLRNTKIKKQIDIEGPLQVGIRKILADSGVLNDRIRFVQSLDPKILSITWVASFLGESVLDVMTRMSNNFDVNLSAIPTQDDGYVLMLEEKEEDKRVE